MRQNTTALASDGDATNNTITYTLDDDAGGRFAIDGVTGVVTVADGTLLDREAAASHNITVRAGSTDGSFNTQVMTINLNDVDEFDVGAVADSDPAGNAVDENAANGTIVGVTALASDADATNNTVTYTLDDDAGGRFAIDGVTGVVTVADGTLLDREAVASHNITVRASSSDGSSSTQVMSININDVDEFDVTVPVDNDPSANQVDENAAIGTVVGITAVATDSDATGNAITYSLDDDDGARFAIDLSTGVVTVAGAIDREADGASRSITVRATSADGSFSTQTFLIAIGDVDEFDVTTPVDTDATANFINENAALGSVVGLTAFADDADATDSVVYSLDDSAGGRFAVDNATGLVTVSGSLDFETAASHDITVRATSSDGSIATQVVTINVGDVNEAPFAADDDGYSALAGTPLTLTPSPLSNDTDVDGDALLIQIVSSPGNGTLSFDLAGNLVYTPDTGFIGTDTITYRADDGSLTSNLATISIDVIAGTSGSGTGSTPDPDPPPNPVGDGGDPVDEQQDEPEDEAESEPESAPTSEAENAGAARSAEGPDVRQVSPVLTTSSDNSNTSAIENEEERAARIRKYFLNSQSNELQVTPERSLELEMFKRLLQLDLEQAIVWQQWDESRMDEDGSTHFFVGTAGVAAGLFSVGYVFWAIRGGAFVAAITSTLPSWRLVDPAALLGAYRASTMNSPDRIEKMLG